MWWKAVLKVAVAVGLDKWAKKKAVALAGKLRAKAETKVKKIEEAVSGKVEKWLGEDVLGNKFVVEKRDGKVIVRRV
jgi:hypothetical protein